VPPQSLAALEANAMALSESLVAVHERPRCSANAIFAIDDIYLNDVKVFWERIALAKLDVTSDCHHSGSGIVLNVPETTGLAQA
jgi:hypothetical protein